MRLTETIVGLGVMAVLAVMVAGCAPRPVSGENATDPTAGTPTEMPETPAGLDGSQWNVIELDGEPVTGDAVGTLDFEDGRVGGKSFCNSFGGTYEIDGDALILGELMQTLMACEDMTLETAYTAALNEVATYRIDGGTLILTDAAGTDRVVLSPAKPASLEGTLWTLTGLADGDAIASPVLGSEVTAEFAEGTLSGSAGCNRYTASYTREGTALTLGPAGATKMACLDPAGVMEQEQAFLAALETVASYATKCASLTLFDADGAVVMTFQATR